MRARSGKPPGRPKGSVNTSTRIGIQMRELLAKRVRREFKPILDAQIDLAKGILVKKKVTLPNGKTYDSYYEKKPEHEPAKYLVDQTIGKPKEIVEHSGEVKSIVEIVSELDSQA